MPLSFWNVPDWQSVHCVAPSTSEYEPASQVKQALSSEVAPTTTTTTVAPTTTTTTTDDYNSSSYDDYIITVFAFDYLNLQQFDDFLLRQVEQIQNFLY